MLTIKWADMHLIHPGVNVLAASPKVDRAIAHRAGRILHAIDANGKKAQKAANALLEKYGKRDEKFNLMRDQRSGNVLFSSDESNRKCNEEMEQQLQTTFEVKVLPIPFKAVEEHLTGAELAGMELVLEGVPDEA